MAPCWDSRNVCACAKKPAPSLLLPEAAGNRGRLGVAIVDVGRLLSLRHVGFNENAERLDVSVITAVQYPGGRLTARLTRCVLEPGSQLPALTIKLKTLTLR